MTCNILKAVNQSDGCYKQLPPLIGYFSSSSSPIGSQLVMWVTVNSTLGKLAFPTRSALFICAIWSYLTVLCCAEAYLANKALRIVVLFTIFVCFVMTACHLPSTGNLKKYLLIGGLFDVLCRTRGQGSRITAPNSLGVIPNGPCSILITDGTGYSEKARIQVTNRLLEGCIFHLIVPLGFHFSKYVTTGYGREFLKTLALPVLPQAPVLLVSKWWFWFWRRRKIWL